MVQTFHVNICGVPSHLFYEYIPHARYQLSKCSSEKLDSSAIPCADKEDIHIGHPIVKLVVKMKDDDLLNDLNWKSQHGGYVCE